MEYHAGEKPGKGTYICIECGHRIILDHDEEMLPTCPQCHAFTYKKA